jgi:hypothetical protein
MNRFRQLIAPGKPYLRCFKSETFGSDARVSEPREHSEIKRERSGPQVSCANDNFPNNHERVDLYLRCRILFQSKEYIEELHKRMNQTLHLKSQLCNSGNITATGKPSIEQILEGTLRASERSRMMSDGQERSQELAQTASCCRASNAIESPSNLLPSLRASHERSIVSLASDSPFQ